MNRHLVAIKGCIVWCADQRMDSNGVALDQDGFESLNGQTVKRGGAIKQNRMTLRHFLQNVPYLGSLAFDHLTSASNRMDKTKLLQSPNNERLEKRQRHLLGNAALMKL